MPGDCDDWAAADDGPGSPRMVRAPGPSKPDPLEGRWRCMTATASAGGKGWHDKSAARRCACVLVDGRVGVVLLLCSVGPNEDLSLPKSTAVPSSRHSAVGGAAGFTFMTAAGWIPRRDGYAGPEDVRAMGTVVCVCRRGRGGGGGGGWGS